MISIMLHYNLLNIWCIQISTTRKYSWNVLLHWLVQFLLQYWFSISCICLLALSDYHFTQKQVCSQVSTGGTFFPRCIWYMNSLLTLDIALFQLAFLFTETHLHIPTLSTPEVFEYAPLRSLSDFRVQGSPCAYDVGEVVELLLWQPKRSVCDETYTSFAEFLLALW